MMLSCVGCDDARCCSVCVMMLCEAAVCSSRLMALLSITFSRC